MIPFSFPLTLPFPSPPSRDSVSICQEAAPRIVALIAYNLQELENLRAAYPTLPIIMPVSLPPAAIPILPPPLPPQLTPELLFQLQEMLAQSSQNTSTPPSPHMAAGPSSFFSQAERPPLRRQKHPLAQDLAPPSAAKQEKRQAHIDKIKLSDDYLLYKQKQLAQLLPPNMSPPTPRIDSGCRQWDKQFRSWRDSIELVNASTSSALRQKYIAPTPEAVEANPYWTIVSQSRDAARTRELEREIKKLAAKEE